MSKSLNASPFARFVRLPGLAGLGLAFALAAGSVLAAGEAGMIKTAKGSVLIERGGQRTVAVIGDRVMPSDTLVTGADGAVGITLRDNTRLSAGPNSVLSLDKFAFDSTTYAGELDASVKKGTLSVISGKLASSSPGTVRFRTPTSTLGIRGTEFVIEVPERGAR
jgi:hypothetical protein